MFERIKPTTQIRTVALPGDIADTLQYVYLCNKIEKRGIIIKGNHGGLRVVHNARIRDTYVPIEESWLLSFFHVLRPIFQMRISGQLSK